LNKDYESWNKDELINELLELRKKKKFGLVWDEKKEEVSEECKDKIPVLNEVFNLTISKDKSSKYDLVLEGDNFHSLVILNSTHQNKIDGIYIDPPYNTGNKDWKYNNSYVDEEDPYRHTKWISFMHKRLVLARNLLTNTGIICVTIDDYEFPRLLMLMEDIFGEQNRLGVVCIRNNPAGRSTQKGISINHEYAIFFSKSSDATIGRMPRSEKQYARYSKEDSRGRYEEVNFRKPGGLKSEAPSMFYPIFIKNESWRIPDMTWEKDLKEWVLNENPGDGEKIIYPTDDKDRGKRWRWGIERVKEESEEIFVKNVKGKSHLFYKGRMTHETVLPNTWWDKKEYSAQDHGTDLLKSIFGDLKTFDYPKAVVAVEDCLRVLTNKKDAIFLDFFAGSGTTGQAVKNLNQSDNGSRQFILCTNNENNIARDDCYERINRIIQGYKDYQTNESVKGIPSNLKFYSIDLIERGESDSHKKTLFENSSSIISLKEEAYVLKEDAEGYKIFEGLVCDVAIISDLLCINEVKERIENQKKSFKVYIFSSCEDDFSDDFLEVNNVEEAISYPEPILENLRRILS
jgi:adenine-specific DNA-methyltransferase